MSTYRFSPMVHLERGRASSIKAATVLARREAEAARVAVHEQYPGLAPTLEDEEVRYGRPRHIDVVLRVDNLPWHDLLPIVHETIEARKQ